MNVDRLREAAYEANMDLQRHGLVIFTWGNASARDVDLGLMAIKPSGVAYEKLRPSNMVIVEIATGAATERGGLRPSSDTITHCILYRAFPAVGGVVHTHSREATAWAQAGLDLPCLGTTHADYFHGPVPCTPEMTSDEITGPPGYEENTGHVIVREFRRRGIDAAEVPAVLVRGHGPFVFGPTACAAAHNAVVLDEVAGIARRSLSLNPSARHISETLADLHFGRKHGPGASYGQK